MSDSILLLNCSHAIMCYMADKYGKNDSLYPKDLRSRALVNQRLHFESGVLFARLRFISVSYTRLKINKSIFRQGLLKLNKIF